MRFLALLLLAAALNAQHIASIYERTPNGSMEFRCSSFPIVHKHALYTALTAAHCVDGDGPYFVAFDGPSITFLPITIGRTGEDFAYFSFETDDPHDLFVLGDSLDVLPGDNLEAVANTLGIGEGIYRGQVVMTEITRPTALDGDVVDARRYFFVQMPSFGGASGAPVKRNGKVVGIVTGTNRGVLAIVLKINVVK